MEQDEKQLNMARKAELNRPQNTLPRNKADRPLSDVVHFHVTG